MTEIYLHFLCAHVRLSGNACQPQAVLLLPAASHNTLIERIEENGKNGSHVLAGHEVIVGVGPVQIERRHVELLGDNSSEILGDLACDVGDVAWEQLSGVSGTGNTRVQNFPHR